MRSVACQITSPNAATASNLPSLYIVSRHGMPSSESRDAVRLQERRGIAERRAARGKAPTEARFTSAVSMPSVYVCVSLACLRVLGVVARAGHPVERTGLARELELLVEAVVVLDVGRVEVQLREMVRAVLVLEVDGLERAPGRGPAEVRPGELVVDEQRGAVERARFLVADGVVVDPGLQRIEVVGRVRRERRPGCPPRAQPGRSPGVRTGRSRRGPT